MYKTPIFIDFDGTLFDTLRFKPEIFDVFIKSGYEQQDINANYLAECLDYKFNLKDLYGRLLEIKSSNEQLVNSRIENLYNSVRRLLYDDAEEFLQAINRDKYEVNILTLGDLEFQTKKVEHSGLRHLVDNIYITDIQKWDFLPSVAKSFEKLVIIDDRADTLERVRSKYNKCLPIQIIRDDIDLEDAAMRMSEMFGGIKIRSLMQALRYLE